MPPTTQDMLKHANEVNATLASNTTEEVVKRVQGKSTLPAPEDLTVESLNDPTEDPFGSNVNNRRVAKRIAAEKGRVYLNHSMPTHLGDPEKARKDIAKSEKLNPSIESPDPDAMPPINFSAKPTPGSPADKKAQEAAKGAKQDGPQTTEQPAAGTQAPATGAVTPPWSNGSATK